MAGSYNKIILIGNLGRDPEMRQTPNGDQVADFSVATSERWRDRNEQHQERTTWFRVSAWGRLAELAAQYLHKGSTVYVEGTLTQRDYTTRDGRAGTSLDVRASEVRLLDRRDAGPPQGETAPYPDDAARRPAVPDDLVESGDKGEIPF